MARSGGTRYIFPARAKPSRRRGPVSSNVRLQNASSSAIALTYVVMPVISKNLTAILLAAAAGGCATTSAPIPTADPQPILSRGEWSGALQIGHPHAPDGYYKGASTRLVIQNCDGVVKTFSMVKDGEFVLDRPYNIRPNEQMTLAYSLAKSKQQNGWREIRALVLYELPSKSLAVSLIRSVSNPTAEPEQQIVESFSNGVLDYSPVCRNLPMAARQLKD